jgi:flagellar basal body rod protein FlgB
MLTNNVFDIAASGLNAAQTQLQTTANNIANQDTPNYKAERADLVDLSGGGVAVSGISQSAAPGDQQGNNVDPAQEMVNLAQEKLMYTANAMVINVANQMVGSLLDIFDDKQQR